jgi:hypothetical protein
MMKNRVEISKYRPLLKEQWDCFIDESKNGTFMQKRDYMEYHKNRFDDFSLLFYYKERLVAILAACWEGETLFSHKGLSFGGFITSRKMTTAIFETVFNAFLQYCRENGFSTLVYKCIPSIYHQLPADEDKYFLFTSNQSRLIRRDLNSVIFLTEYQGIGNWQVRRKRALKKGKSVDLTIQESGDYKQYWDILSDNLYSRHKIKPVHTLQEIKSLQSKFPNQIKLFAAFDDNEMLAGVVTYLNKNVFIFNILEIQIKEGILAQLINLLII